MHALLGTPVRGLCVVVDAKNVLYVQLVDAISRALAGTSPDVLPVIPAHGMRRVVGSIGMLQRVAATANVPFELVVALELRAAGDGQAVPHKQRVAAGKPRGDLEDELAELLGALQSTRGQADGSKVNLLRGKYSRRRTAEKAAKRILALSSFRGREADMVCAILRTSFAAFGFGDRMVGIVDADGLFSSYPRQDVRLYVVMTTDNDIFANFGGLAAQLGAALLAWRGAEVVGEVVTRLKMLDVRRATAAFIDGMFPFVKSLCNDAGIREAIYSSPLALALDVGRWARVPVPEATVRLLKLAASMSSFGMENVPPLFESSAKTRKPGVKVALVLDRALKLMSETPGMTLLETMSKDYVTRKVHGVQFLRKAAASRGLVQAVALGAFARCRYQGEKGDLIVCLERHFVCRTIHVAWTATLLKTCELC